jgi:tetratricopeptide (TPR) repeat protein
MSVRQRFAHLATHHRALEVRLGESLRACVSPPNGQNATIARPAPSETSSVPKFPVVFALCVASLLAQAKPASAGELETVFFKNDQDAVEQQAKAMLRRAPADNEANAWLAETAMKQGKWNDANAALAKAGTTTMVGLLAHGDFAWYTGDFAAAQGHYEAALAKVPGDPHALWGLASAYLHQDQFAPALEIALDLERAGDKLDPDFHGWVLVLVGACKAGLGEHANMLEKIRLAAEVRGAFERAVGLSPKNPNGLSALGRFYLLAPFILGDADKAVDYLSRADTMDPFFYLNDAFLIRAYIKDGKPDKAKVERAFYQAKFQGLSQPAAELLKIKL